MSKITDTSYPTAAALDGTEFVPISQSSAVVRASPAQISTFVRTAAGGTVTTSAPMLDLTQTWNAAGVTFTGLRANFTDTASGASSLLVDLQLNGVSRFQVLKDGSVFSPFIRSNSDVGQISLGASFDVVLNRDAADTLAQRRGVNTQTFRVYATFTDVSNYRRLAVTPQVLRYEAAGTGVDNSSYYITNSMGALIFQTGGSNDRWQINASGHFLASADTAYDIGASGANRPRNIYAATSVVAPRVQTTALTVATLPAGNPGDRAYVSDSTVAAAGNFGAVVAGGGTNGVPVYKDASNWRIG